MNKFDNLRVICIGNNYHLTLDGNVVGEANTVFTDKPCPIVFLERIMVENNFQGRGYGGFFLREICDSLAALGATGLTINGIKTHKPEFNMYQNNGWESVSGVPFRLLAFPAVPDIPHDKLLSIVEELSIRARYANYK